MGLDPETFLGFKRMQFYHNTAEIQNLVVKTEDGGSTAKVMRISRQTECISYAIVNNMLMYIIYTLPQYVQHI